MPAFLSGLFGSIVAWLGQWFTKKVAMAVAASGTFVALSVNLSLSAAVLIASACRLYRHSQSYSD